MANNCDEWQWERDRDGFNEEEREKEGERKRDCGTLGQFVLFVYETHLM